MSSSPHPSNPVGQGCSLRNSTEDGDDLTGRFGAEDQMLRLDTVLSQLALSVTHVGVNTVKNNISVLPQAHHREFFTLTISKSRLVTLVAAKILTDKASLGYHQGDSSVGDNPTANISCLRQSKLGRKNKMFNTHIMINKCALAVSNVQPEVAYKLKSKRLCEADLTDIAYIMPFSRRFLSCSVSSSISLSITTGGRNTPPAVFIDSTDAV